MVDVGSTLINPLPVDSEEEDDYEFDYDEQEGEFDEEEEGEVEEQEEEEDQGVDKDKEEVKTKRKRCKRRMKVRQVCLDFGDIDEEEIEKYFIDDVGECEEVEDIPLGEVSITSSVLSAISFQWEHKTYEFEELCDPGILKSIREKYFVEPFYPDNIGQMRYLYLCRLLYVSPVLRFYLALESDTVDLSFRNFDSKNFRAMCSALAQNTFVENFILKYNKLSPDDCYYLGNMLSNNETITFLDLTGCRIGPEGVEKLAEHLDDNTVLQNLNLSKNNIQNEGALVLSKFLTNTEALQILDLSYNLLEDEAAEALGNVLKTNKSITTLNLCYNKLFDMDALKGLFKGLSLNTTLTHLNLSWNGISGEDNAKNLSKALQKNEGLEYLDLSCNRFDGPRAGIVLKGAGKNKTLKTILLGKNPILPEDLSFIMPGIKACKNLELLNLEDLWAKKSFMKELRAIQNERQLKVIIGGVLGTYEIIGPDFHAILLKRAKYEAQKSKKKKLKKDFGHFIWSLGRKPITEADFREKLKKFKTKLHKDLVAQLIEEYTMPKVQLIDVAAMKNKYLSIFPDSEPPPGKKLSDEASEEEIEVPVAPPVSKKKGKAQKTEPKPEVTFWSDEEYEEDEEGGEFEFDYGEGEEDEEDEDEESEESEESTVPEELSIPEKLPEVKREKYVA